MYPIIILILILIIFYNTILKNIIIYLTYKLKFGNEVKFLIYPLNGYSGFLKDSFNKHGDTNYLFK
jgi:hypothetical protein